MEKLNFDEQINRLRKNHLLFKRLLGGMVLANILLLLILMWTIDKEKLVLVPQVAPEYKLWVMQSQVSNEYLAVLSRNITDLMLNVTYSNVDAQHKEVLRMVSSRHIATLQSQLAGIAKAVTDNHISQNFYINSIKVVNNKNVVYITGSLNNYIDRTLASSVEHIYKLTFDVANYGVQLTNFELIDANDPQMKDLK